MTRDEFDGVVWAMIKLFALLGFSLAALVWSACLVYEWMRAS